MTLDHIVLYVSNLTESERFYNAFLEQSSKAEDSIVYRIGDVLLFIADKENNNSPQFDKANIGLNHLAFGLTSIDELKDYKKKLNEAGIKHSGVQIDKYGGKEFIWFDDPDGMRLEFYLRND